jgi:hypothetical protein
MAPEILVPFLVTTLVAIIGWYAAHRLSATRDRANKRRELRVQYLIEAYRRLENASNRPSLKGVVSEFEKAIADIQLFGTPRQVALAQEFALGFALAGTHSLDPLMNDLRNSLRAELDLEPVTEGIKYLRISFDE